MNGTWFGKKGLELVTVTHVELHRRSDGTTGVSYVWRGASSCGASACELSFFLRTYRRA